MDQLNIAIVKQRELLPDSAAPLNSATFSNLAIFCLFVLVLQPTRLLFWFSLPALIHSQTRFTFVKQYRTDKFSGQMCKNM